MRRALRLRMMVAGRTTERESMNLPDFRSLPRDQEGRVGYILLWLLGVPIPVLFLIYLLRGCT
jgi:hypothetical protein